MAALMALEKICLRIPSFAIIVVFVFVVMSRRPCYEMASFFSAFLHGIVDFH